MVASGGGPVEGPAGLYLSIRRRLRGAGHATVACAAALVASTFVLAGGVAVRPTTFAVRITPGSLMPPGLRSAAQRDIAASEAPFRVVRQGRILLASGGGLTSAFGPSGVRVRVAGGTLDLVLGPQPNNDWGLADH